MVSVAVGRPPSRRCLSQCVAQDGEVLIGGTFYTLRHQGYRRQMALHRYFGLYMELLTLLASRNSHDGRWCEQFSDQITETGLQATQQAAVLPLLPAVASMEPGARRAWLQPLKNFPGPNSPGEPLGRRIPPARRQRERPRKQIFTVPSAIPSSQATSPYLSPCESSPTKLMLPGAYLYRAHLPEFTSNAASTHRFPPAAVFMHKLYSPAGTIIIPSNDG